MSFGHANAPKACLFLCSVVAGVHKRASSLDSCVNYSTKPRASGAVEFECVVMLDRSDTDV